MSDTLFSPVCINRLELKNRLMMTALGLEIGNNGTISQKYKELYIARAKGGVGSVVIPSKIAYWAGKKYFTSLDDPESLSGFRELSAALHDYNCKLFVQLFHAGRNMLSYEDVQSMAPSPVPSPLYRASVPKEMEQEDIDKTIAQFAAAAVAAKENQIDGVEVNCCAGYLLSSFLSPLSNQREDQYGGSEENRSRIVIQVMQAIRKAVGPDYPVTIRVSAQMLKGGYDLGVVSRLCHKLDQMQLIDGVAVIGGWHESPVPLINYYVPPAGYAHFGGAIKQSVKVPVILNIRIHSRETAEKIIDEGFADIIGGGRPYMADAGFAECLEKGQPFNACVSCNKGCIEANFKGERTSCIFNPAFGNEDLEASIGPVWDSKQVLVAGGGVAGMYAAYTAARRGAKVTLYQSEAVLGGKLYAVAAPPGKQDFTNFISYMESKLGELGVSIVCGRQVDASLIASEKPDFVVVAVGSEPVVPAFARTSGLPVLTAEEVLLGGSSMRAKLKQSHVVIIGGGSVGLETADYLSANTFFSPEEEAFFRKYAWATEDDPFGGLYCPADLTVVEMLPKMGKGMGGTRYPLMRDLKDRQVRLLSSTSVQSITEQEVLCIDCAGNEIRLPADYIIIAAGYRPRGQQLVEALQDSQVPYCVIGDAYKARDIQAATVEAYESFSKKPEEYGIM